MKSQKKLQRKLINVALSTATLVSTSVIPMVSGLLPAAQAASVTAKSADAFVDSVCVNTHFWYDWGSVKPKLQELGIRHHRTGDLDAQLVKDLYNNYGIKLTMIVSPGFNSNDLKNYVKSIGVEKFDGISGPNEPSLFIKGDYVSIARNTQKQLWETLKGDSVTKSIPILTFSPVFPDDAYKLGDVSQWSDMTDIHLYYGGQNPELKGDAWGTLNWMRKDLAGPVGADQPIVITETGYHNTRQTDGHIGTPDLGVVAKYIPRLYLYHFKQGITRSCVYQLYDDGTNPNEQEHNFGLLRYDYSNKPSFDAVKNLLKLLSDRGANFKPGSLDFSLSGSTNNVETLLLQKQNGRFFLSMWLGASSFDRQAQKALSVPSQKVTVSLPKNISGAVIHKIGADGKLTSKNVTVSNGQLNMDVSDAVSFVEIAGSTGGSTSGSTGSSQSNPAVTFYEDANYAGKSQTFSVGKYYADRGQLNTVGNDNISSLRVPKGLTVNVCENESGGLCRSFGPGDYSYVGDDLNDIISYIEVKSN